MKVAYVARGLPGSGKSTRVRTMVAGLVAEGRSVVVCSSDDFFVCPCCQAYNFGFDKLHYAHMWCRAKFDKAIKDDIEVVVVDNTNVTVREVRPYVEMAMAADYEVRFLEPQTPWAFDIDQLVVKNTHGVPREGLERMLARWVPEMSVEKALRQEPQQGKQTPDERAAGAK